MTKKNNKETPIVEVADGEDGHVIFNMKLVPYSPASIDARVEGRFSDSVKLTLEHIKQEISSYKLYCKKPPLFNSVDGKQVSDIDSLVSLINDAESQLSNGSFLELSLTMYDMGIVVWRINNLDFVKGKGDNLRQLGKIRASGAEATKLNAAERKKALRDYAIAYFMNYPASTNHDAIREMSNSNTPTIKKSASMYTNEGLVKIIVGCKKTALEKITKK